MDWLLVFAVTGAWTAGDVRVDRMTEQQCKALVAAVVDNEFHRCLAPDGQWWPRKPE